MQRIKGRYESRDVWLCKFVNETPRTRLYNCTKYLNNKFFVKYLCNEILNRSSISINFSKTEKLKDIYFLSIQERQKQFP